MVEPFVLPEIEEGVNWREEAMDCVREASGEEIEGAA